MLAGLSPTSCVYAASSGSAGLHSKSYKPQQKDNSGKVTAALLAAVEDDMDCKRTLENAMQAKAQSPI
jgi:hypothetical protein